MNDHEQRALRELYRNTRDEAPSELLDQRIRRAAMHQLGRRRRHWIRGLSTAAVLVLAFSVVIQLDWLAKDPLLESAMDSDSGSSSPAQSRSYLPTAPEFHSDQAAAPMAPPVHKKQAFNEQPMSAAETSEPLRPEPRRSGRQATESKALSLPDRFASDQAEPAARRSAEIAAPVQIPLLPHDPDELQTLAPGLGRGAKDHDWLTFCYDDRRVLDMQPDSTGTRFRARPGSEVLGVVIDWKMERDALNACHDEGTYTVCGWLDGVEAVFADERLDHVRWYQPR